MKREAETVATAFANCKQIEKEILSTLVTFPESFEIVKYQALEPKHFQTTEHKEIYQAILNLGSPSCGQISLIQNELLRENASGRHTAATLSDLMDSFPAPTLLPDLVKRLKAAFYRNLIGTACHTVWEMASKGEDVETLISSITHTIDSIHKENSNIEIEAFSEGINELLDMIEKGGGDGLRNVSTGFDMLDKYLCGGIKEGQFVIAAARPSMGKTLIGLQISGHAAVRKNKHVLFVTLEMPKTQLLLRYISSVSSTIKEHMMAGLVTPEFWRTMAEEANTLLNTKKNFWCLDLPRIDIDHLCSKIRSFSAQKGGLDLVVIDYLGRIEAKNKKDKYAEVTHISSELKALARELKCGVLCMAQLNRQVEFRQEKKPWLSDLRDSGGVEQDADVVLLLHRDDYYDPMCKNRGLLELIIAKNRNGETGTVYLEHELQYQRFKNTDRTPVL